MKKLALLIILLLATQLRGACQAVLTRDNLINDLDVYTDQIERNHPNPFDSISRKDFRHLADSITHIAANINTDRLLVAILQLNARIEDEHTIINFRDSMAFSFNVYWYDEGMYTWYTKGDNYMASFSKVIALNGLPLDTVVGRIATIIPCKNKMQIRYRVGWYINSPKILHGLGINDGDSLSLTVMNDDGTVITSKLPAISRRLNGVVHIPNQDKLLRYKHGRNYWYSYDSVKDFLYFKYSSCMEDKNNPFIAFNKSLFKTIKENKPDRIIIDLRNNGGGHPGILLPFFQELQTSYLNKKGKIFVLIDKGTFSAAILDAIELKRTTRAILAGEETSGSVNHYGAIQTFVLPNTAMTVVYSTAKVITNHSYDGPLLPDIKMPETFSDLKAGKDGLLDYVSIVKVL